LHANVTLPIFDQHLLSISTIFLLYFDEFSPRLVLISYHAMSSTTQKPTGKAEDKPKTETTENKVSSLEEDDEFEDFPVEGSRPSTVTVVLGTMVVLICAPFSIITSHNIP
jgi:hypothetical protein